MMFCFLVRSASRRRLLPASTSVSAGIHPKRQARLSDSNGTLSAMDAMNKGTKPKKQIEVERKFTPGDGFEQKLKDLGATLVKVTTFTDAYVDTPTMTLTLADHWLRRRDSRWELKCPVPGHVARGRHTTHYAEYEAEADITRYLRPLLENASAMGREDEGQEKPAGGGGGVTEGEGAERGGNGGEGKVVGQAVSVSETQRNADDNEEDKESNQNHEEYWKAEDPGGSEQLGDAGRCVADEEGDDGRARNESGRESGRSCSSPADGSAMATKTMVARPDGEARPGPSAPTITPACANWRPLEGLLRGAKCWEFARFSSERKTYSLGGLSVDLDATDWGFQVGEIETLVADESQISDAVARIDKLANKLGVQCSSRVAGKMDVYLQQNMPDHYDRLMAAFRARRESSGQGHLH